MYLKLPQRSYLHERYISHGPRETSGNTFCTEHASECSTRHSDLPSHKKAMAVTADEANPVVAALGGGRILHIQLVSVC